jgi:F-type H+-transporting ATPase subunit c
MNKIAKMLVWTLVLTAAPLAAFAEEAAGSSGSSAWGYALGAGLAVGLAGLGCGIGQGLTAGNNMSGIARNPGAAGGMFLNYILALAFIESIAIYGLLIGLQLVGKIH